MVDCEASVLLTAATDEETAPDTLVGEVDDVVVVVVVVDSVTPRPWRMNVPSPAAEEELDDPAVSEVVSLWISESSAGVEMVLLEVEPDVKLLVVELSVALPSALQPLRPKHTARRTCHLESIAVPQDAEERRDHDKKV